MICPYTLARRCQLDGSPGTAATLIYLLAVIETYRDPTLTMAEAEEIVASRVAARNWMGDV